jgi:tryptophan-rich sensory protein
MKESADRAAEGVKSALAKWLGLAVSLGACLAAGAVGSAWMDDSSLAWYEQLSRPAWNPPSWVFGPVWSALYVLMAVAAWRVWLKWPRHGVPVALAAFATQLVLNAIWTGLFFALRSPAAGLADIVALWVAIGVTAWLFRPISQAAAWLMAPYWLWVTYAFSLNLGIYFLNPPRPP